ncbi:MAG: indolepyruvate oxidoreductase subunit beta [Acidimicrobiia bacterium]|nr:indolepyruvate oxidoreductase subunit beta [Acidimicrobiia bacterium]
MKFDIILAGVGGQGVLSISAVIAGAAARLGWQVKQSEVHGMAQRGGAVLAHLRMATGSVHSDLIPRGCADLILSLEPMESLRYLEYLSPTGTIATAAEPVENIDDYPDLDALLEAIRAIRSNILVEATQLAKQAGNVKTANMVMVGAVAHSLPVAEEDLRSEISTAFGHLGENVLEANLEAFRLGREAGRPFLRRSGATTLGF